MYDIVGKRRYYFLFSALITVPGIVFILLGGLRPSIDFTGGTVWEVRFASQPSVDEVRDAVVRLGYPDAVVTARDGGYVSIRTDAAGLIAPPATPSPPATPLVSPPVTAPASPPTSPVVGPGSPAPTATATATPTPAPSAPASPPASPGGSPQALPPVASDTEFGLLREALIELFGEATDRQVVTIGPIIGAELIRTSAILIGIGELFILAYLWMRFGFRFGTAAIVALLHDVILVVGTFAILGYLFGLEFDALFVTALLTVIGFSVHDTIVVFDRIRENRVRHADEPFGAIVNHSILQTMGRSIITSITVVVTLAALLLLGPPTIRTFTLALLLGIVSGTYSSIFNAAQILVAWHEWDRKRKAREPRTRRSFLAISNR